LQAERHSLEALLRPPSIANISDLSNTQTDASSTAPSLLSACDAQIVESLASTRTSSEIVSLRLNAISASLGPTIDAFADGLHRIAQYRNAADNVAGQVLKMCADRLEDREKEGRRHALGEAAAMSTTKDEVGSVLRSLSRLE
jgi:kinetochore protein Mis13/DSN1